ncbi:MAG: SnoaL-like domain-containing protein [Planctomycetota bacterium]
MSSVLEVGKQLVSMCRAGQWNEAMAELYADEATHVEAYEMGPEMPRENGPKAKLLKMTEWWDANHEVHGCELQGPYPHGDDRFAVRMTIDLTPKEGSGIPNAGKRHTQEEVCVYTVADGKITMVEFFWDPTGYGES